MLTIQMVCVLNASRPHCWPEPIGGPHRRAKPIEGLRGHCSVYYIEQEKGMGVISDTVITLYQCCLCCVVLHLTWKTEHISLPE